MKRLFIFYSIVTTACAMEQVFAMELRSLLPSITVIRAQIISMLAQNKPLSDTERNQAEELIKQIRVQSPAQGLDCQEKLSSRLADDLINAEGFELRPNCRLITVGRSPSRTPSPFNPCWTVSK